MNTSSLLNRRLVQSVCRGFVRGLIPRVAATSHMYTSYRRKTYLVGVDGGDYGYHALAAAAKHAQKGDKIISAFFPTTIAVVLEQQHAFRLSDDQIDMIRSDFMDAQEHNKGEIETKCKAIIEKNGPAHINAYCDIEPETLAPRDDLIKACYTKNADVLVVGCKGLPHSMAEKVTEKVTGVGTYATYCVHNAPCDVMIVKGEHEY